MTTIHDAILARINQGPANRIDLHAACMTQCGIGEAGAAALWGMITTETAALEAAHLIAAHPAGCWTLPASAAMEPRPDEPAKQLRPGTTIPKNLRHLVRK